MTAGSAITLFVDRTLDETVQLLEETRSYVASAESRSDPAAEPATALRATCEALRLTTRLAQVLAWLLARKAVVAGELTTEEARQRKWRLGSAATCGDMSHENDPELPGDLQDLLQRSRQLYVRISRLDELVGQTA
ncbi:MAG: DUF1465 family protein [Alphaproteobacteria bacterium]